jgi:hypothetical protein
VGFGRGSLDICYIRWLAGVTLAVDGKVILMLTDGLFDFIFCD